MEGASRVVGASTESAAASTQSDSRGSWHRDLLASIVVFLVALPLCMGIAIASGVPVAAGLATGIIGGIVVGLLAGAPLQVSGPAAGLTVIVLGIVHQQGLEALGLVVLIAGGLQIAAGLTGIGQWFRAVSPSVVEGMLAGIGILIFAGQFHVMVDSAPHRHGWENIYELPSAIRKGLPWPEPTSREQRLTQSAWLRELGTLHADQLQLETAVLRRRSPADAKVISDPERFAPLVPKQEQQVARLEESWQRSLKLTNAQLDDSRRLPLQMNLKEALAAAHTALDDLRQGNLKTVQTTQVEASKALAVARNQCKDHATAAKLGLLTIAIMLAWQVMPWKSLKLIPAPLIAVTMATVAAALLASPVLYVEVPHQIVSDLRLPSLRPLIEGDWRAVLQMGFVVALVASAETLLCASAVDQMHQGPRTKYNRELAAQGVGNMLCGLVGALPMTGVIVRSAANVQAGATSRLSAIFHGIWLLIFVALLGSLLRMIPIASLAAMLVYTGVRLVNVKALRTFWRLDKFEAAIFIITATVVVVEDLLKGVVIGIVLAAVKLLWQFAYLKVEVTPATKQQPLTVSLSGAATFLRLPQLAQALENISPRDKVRLVTNELSYIDHACLELITHWQKRHLAAGGELDLNIDELAARYRHRALETGDANL